MPWPPRLARAREPAAVSALARDFDDVGAILVVTIGYGDPLNWIALGAAGLGLAAVAGISQLGVRKIAVYFAIGGGIWLAFDISGVHATVTGVILGLMTPARAGQRPTLARDPQSRGGLSSPAIIGAGTRRPAATSSGRASQPAKRFRRSNVSRSRSTPGWRSR